MSKKPCKATCEKCGSGDVLHQHHMPGSRADRGYGCEKGRSSAFVDRSWSTGWTVRTECIIHTCRVCGWYWDGAVMTKHRPANPAKEGM